MKGRKPKPTSLKVVQGNPGGRPLNVQEPAPTAPSATPTPPAWLDDYGQEYWNDNVDMLLNCGILTDADLSAFAQYCDAWSIFRHAHDEVRRSGMFEFGDNGETKRSGALITLEKARADLLRHASEFGCTPSARTRVQRVEKTEDDEAVKLLRR